MGLFKKDPKEARYVGGEKHFAEVIQNVGVGGDMISLHPDEDFNTNSVLVVNPGEQAIFVKNGQIQHVFDEGRHLLKTENYPFISRIRNAFTGGVSSFSCRVFFVRTASSIEVKWGCGGIQVRDKVLRVQTDIAARGAYKIKVGDAGRFLFKLIGNNIRSFSPESLEEYFSCELRETIKCTIASVVNSLNEEILGIQSRQKEISDNVSAEIKEVFDEYGVELLKFSISDIQIKEDELRRRYDDKVGDAVADRERMKELGLNWMQMQQVDIMKTMAQNSGGNSSIGADIAMGFFAGQQVMNMGQQMAQQAAPPPTLQFYIYLNGQNVGPLQVPQLTQYVQSGYLTPDTLVWKNGMPQWAPAKQVPELQFLFGAGTVPPPVPPVPPVPNV